MQRLFAISLLFILASCAVPDRPQTEAKRISTIAESAASTEPYTIQIDIEEAEGQAPSLRVSMMLAEGSHFVSPYSSDRFTGRFGIYIEENPHLKLESNFVETPRSVEEFDPHPFTNGLVNWVRVNTTYHHVLRVASKDDFEAAGLVSFTIEPRCTFEEVRFFVVQRDGKLMVKMA